MTEPIDKDYAQLFVNPLIHIVNNPEESIQGRGIALHKINLMYKFIDDPTPDEAALRNYDKYARLNKIYRANVTFDDLDDEEKEMMKEFEKDPSLKLKCGTRKRINKRSDRKRSDRKRSNRKRSNRKRH